MSTWEFSLVFFVYLTGVKDFNEVDLLHIDTNVESVTGVCGFLIKDILRVEINRNYVVWLNV